MKLEMLKDFKGDNNLLIKYNELIKDIKQTYNNGPCICFAGQFGVGKTMVCTNVLKRAVEKGYSALYTTLTDIISIATSLSRYDARNELLSVDFLVIDEFDPRYMPTDNASDFFGRVLEDIFRTRSQNSLPLFMCTNSPNVTESFSGSIKQSLSSLMNQVETVIVFGKDYRTIK